MGGSIWDFEGGGDFKQVGVCRPERRRFPRIPHQQIAPCPSGSPGNILDNVSKELHDIHNKSLVVFRYFNVSTYTFNNNDNERVELMPSLVLFVLKWLVVRSVLFHMVYLFLLFGSETSVNVSLTSESSSLLHHSLERVQ